MAMLLSFGATSVDGSVVGFSVGLCDGRVDGLLVLGDGIRAGASPPKASGSGLVELQF